MTKFLGPILALSCLAFALAASPASATTITYTVIMDGSQEVPGPGDADGTASGTLTVNDVSGLIEWSFTYANIAAPTAMHIHGPNAPAGVAAGVFVNLGVATSGGPGTLIGSTTTSAVNAAAINAEPAEFYVNIHNSAFSGGAVRGQVPEPGTLGLLGLGLAGLVWNGRRR